MKYGSKMYDHDVKYTGNIWGLKLKVQIVNNVFIKLLDEEKRL